jgi:thiamine biosynthesis lipoprotein
VTVIGESGILCDALSTAFFVAGFERTVSMWQQSEDYDLILVTDDGEIYITEGIAAYTRMTDGLTAEVIYSEEKD